jgi:hypothetical protein
MPFDLPSLPPLPANWLTAHGLVTLVAVLT